MRDAHTWVTDRPLDPEEGARICASRSADIERLLELLTTGHRRILVWSPPKWGTTTFFRQLVHRARQDAGWEFVLALPQRLAKREADPNARFVLLLDQMHELESQVDISQALLSAAEVVGDDGDIVVAGDSRTLKAARSLEWYRDTTDFSLSWGLPETA